MPQIAASDQGLHYLPLSSSFQAHEKRTIRFRRFSESRFLPGALHREVHLQTSVIIEYKSYCHYVTTYGIV